MTDEKDSSPESSQQPATRSETKVKKSGGGCFKFILVFFIVTVLIFSGVAAAGWWALNKFLAQTGGPDLPAQASVEIISGTTELKTNGSWTALNDGSTISIGTTIRTNSNSQAEITFPAGSQIRLDENTQVTVAESDNDSTVISQTLGRTWSRIGKILGRKNNYEIESATTLATVRGTAFAFIVSEEESMVDTDDGQVEVAAIEKVSGERKILSKITVENGFGAGIFTKDISDLKAGRKQLIKVALTEEFKNSDWFKENRERDKKFLERLKAKGVNPLELLKLIRSTSPGDFMKLQSLARKIASKEIIPSESQIEEFAGISNKLQTKGMTEDIAMQLAKLAAQVDPANFSDTSYWKNVFKNISPVLKLKFK